MAKKKRVPAGTKRSWWRGPYKPALPSNHRRISYMRDGNYRAYPTRTGYDWDS